MERERLLAILAPMLADFKREIEELRRAGATPADIDAMLDDFEQTYGPGEEAKIVLEVLRRAAQSNR